jgi:hypothetical protein
LTEFEIPDDLKPILKDITIRKKLLILTLGPDYNEKSVIETINNDWTRFKKTIRSSLKEKWLDSENIAKIINLIQDNHDKIYPDFEGYQSSSDVVQNENPDSERPKIEYDKWQSILFEKYMEIERTCDKNFPGIWHSLEFELSILRILNLKGCSLPFAAIILGMPSSLKTLGIELLRDCKNVYYTNNFSAKAFVSHTTSVPKDQLPEIDLLPRIKNKCMLASELSSVLSKKDEDLMETLGILTVILDGNGYQSDSGVHGRRGYCGEYMFTMIGAAVDVSYKVYKHLTNLGPKLYFLRMPKSYKTDDDYSRMLQSDDFIERKNELKEKINDYMDWFDKFCPFEIDEKSKLVKIPVDMESEDTKNIIQIIVRLGKLLARLRGNVTTFHTEKTQGSNYGYSTPIREDPERAMTQLRNLAKAHAVSQGRTYLTIDDIPILIKVVLSTASRERTMIFDLLLAGDGKMNTTQIVKSLNISSTTALRTMAELKALELVSGNFGNEEYLYEGMENYSNEQYKITLHPDFEWFLTDEFRKLREGYIPKGECKYTKDDASIKKNSPHIQQKISIVNTKSATIIEDQKTSYQPQQSLQEQQPQKETTGQTIDIVESDKEIFETKNSYEFDGYPEDKELNRVDEKAEDNVSKADRMLKDSNDKEISSENNHPQDHTDNSHATTKIQSDNRGHNVDKSYSVLTADSFPSIPTAQLSKDIWYTVLLQQIIKNSLTRGKIS